MTGTPISQRVPGRELPYIYSESRIVSKIPLTNFRTWYSGNFLDPGDDHESLNDKGSSPSVIYRSWFHQHKFATGDQDFSSGAMNKIKAIEPLFCNFIVPDYRWNAISRCHLNNSYRPARHSSRARLYSGLSHALHRKKGYNPLPFLYEVQEIQTSIRYLRNKRNSILFFKYL